MKKITLFAAFILSSCFAMAQAPEGKALPGDTYGAKISAENAMSIGRVPVLLKEKDTVKVKVKAIVVSSCTKKGCWMNLKIDDNTTAFVKMKDYEFFVPTAIAGKMVVVEGIAYNETTSVEELKHYAEDAKKSKAEIDAIKEPRKQVRFLVDGILVVEK